MSDLLITSIVDKNYYDYTELFCWCTKKSYPEYDVKVFNKDEIFPGYKDGYTTNALRMVMPPDLFKDYPWVYITDCDILILRENPSLLDIHLDDLTGNFSNSIRFKSSIFSHKNETWNGLECLSGLHFCTSDWFRAVESQAKKYREYLKTEEVGRGFDGRMLYLMCKELGYPIPKKKKLIKRHHGIHIGTFRLWEEGKSYINRPGKSPMTREQAQRSIDKRMKDWKVKRWFKYMQDSEYKNIVGKMTNPDVISQVKKLEDYCNRKMKS